MKGWNVEEKEVKSPKLKAKQRLERSREPLGICDGTDTFGDDGVENSRLTIPWIITFVNYIYSTSIDTRANWFEWTRKRKKTQG